MYLRHNHRGRPIGKPDVAITLTFSAPMQVSSIASTSDYQVAWTSFRFVRTRVAFVNPRGRTQFRTIRTRVPVYHPVAIVSVTPESNSAVTIETSTFANRFRQGGQLTITSPSAIQSLQGAALGAPYTFVISPKASGISPA